MKILLIGGAGHIGMHLTPRLISEGHEVTVMNREGAPAPSGFEKVRFIYCDSGNEEELNRVAEKENFEVVVDIPGSAATTWKVFRDRAEHIIACGSFWMLGKPNIVPTPETYQAESPFGWAKNRFEKIREILAESYAHKAEFSVVLPSNICGPGKVPIDAWADRSVENHKRMMRGEEVLLPDGADAFIMPCDASDLAQLFSLVIKNRQVAAGQIFNGGTNHALTATQFVREYGRIYNVEIPIRYISWEEYKENVNPDMGAWWHFYSDMCPDISKARRLLGYEPRYSSEEALERAVNWMREQKLI